MSENDKTCCKSVHHKQKFCPHGVAYYFVDTTGRFTCFKGVGAAGVAGLFTASGVPRPELNVDANDWEVDKYDFSSSYLVGVASRLSTSILLGRGELERDLFSPEGSDFLTQSNFLFSTTVDGSASICTTGREVSNPTAIFLETAFTTVAGGFGLATLLDAEVGIAFETFGFLGGLSWTSCCGFERSSFKAFSASKWNLGI